MFNSQVLMELDGLGRNLDNLAKRVRKMEKLAGGSSPLTGLADPTAQVGLVVVNGVATTAMRSDAAPPLDQNIAPIWTSTHTHVAGAASIGIVVQGDVAQVANLQEWQDDVPVTLLSVEPDGDLNFSTGIGIIHADGVSAGPPRQLLIADGIRYIPGTLAATDLAAHNILSSQHGDTLAAAVSQGSLIYGNVTPRWAELTHPGGAGYAFTTTATDVLWDQTPTWTGDHTWDDGVGDSPSLILIGGSDDQASIFLEDDGTPGDSDLVIRLPGTDADAQLQIQSSAPAVVAYIDAAGSACFTGHVGVGSAIPSATRIVDAIDTTTANAGTYYGLVTRWTFSPTANFTVSGYGYRGRASLATAQNRIGGQFTGIEGIADVNNSIAATSVRLRGGNFYVDVEDASATQAMGIRAETSRVDTGSTTEGWGMLVVQGAIGAGSITTLYGIEVENITGGGTNWAIRTGIGDVRFGDAVHIVDFLYHDGDPNTFLSFTPDAIDIQAGGVQFLTITEAGQDTLVVNEGGVDIDFRVEAFGVADALQVRGSDGQITLGALGTGLVKSTAGILSIGALASDLPVHTHADATEGGATISATLYNAAATVSAVFTHSANLVLDDGVGNSPLLQFVGGSNNDTIIMFLDDDAVVGDSDLVIRLIDTSGDSGLIIQSGAPSDILSIFSDGDVVIRDDAAAALKLEDAGGLNLLAFDTSNAQPVVKWNEGGANVDYYIEANAAPNAFFLRGLDGRLGLNIGAPLAQLDVDQKDGGAGIPVLKLDQEDVSEPCVLYSVSGADADIVLWEIDVTGAPNLAWDESEDALQFSHALSVRATPALASGLYVPWINGDVLGATAYFGSDNANNDETAVFAISDSAIAIIGLSEDADGIFGRTNAADVTVNGVHGSATGTGRGVLGTSGSGIGGEFTSGTGYALIANLTGAGSAIAEFRDNGTPVLTVQDGGQADFAEYLRHLGDPDTYRRFQTNRFSDVAGGVTFLDAQTAAQDYLNLHAGLVGINETANANMEIGLTIDQGPNDGEILNFRSSDVGVVRSDLVETGTYLMIRKYQGSSGGVDVQGFKDSDGNNYGALRLLGNLEEDTDVVKTTDAHAILELWGVQATGAALENTVANGNVVVIRTRRGGASVTTHWFDEDGDFGYDGALVPYDYLDDAAMARDLQLVLTDRQGVRYNQDAMVAAGILHPSEHGIMVSHKKMTALQLGAHAQAYDDRRALEARIEYLERQLGTNQ